MKKKIPKRNIKKAARLHAALSLALFSLYIMLSAIYSPEFLISDIKNKFSALADSAITITAKVLGPPVQPIVLATSSCENGFLSISLAWQTDENSESYNISRNNLLLATGLLNSQYLDTNVQSNATYSYTVTALGTMSPGMATSEPVIIDTPKECVKSVSPIELSNISVSKEPGKYDASNPFLTTLSRPAFSGTVNTPNAIIRFMLPSSVLIYGQITANVNGYWTWTPSLDLSDGSYSLLITALDSADSTRATSKNFYFAIKTTTTNNDESDQSSSSKIKPPKVVTNSSPQETGQPKPSQVQPSQQNQLESQTQPPVAFSLSIKTNPVLQGKDLETFLKIEKVEQKYNNSVANLKYSLVDKNGKAVFSVLDKKNIYNNEGIEKTLSLPNHVSAGFYKLVVEVFNNDFNISKSLNFEIKSIPVIMLGGGFVLTYPEILSNLGNISLLFLALLFIWLFFLSREYWLYLHALRNITEKNLSKVGMIVMKKKNKRA
ncbi:MAG: Ig-like domain-containing protein [Candidatus Moraniibacteriota bacterium]